MSHDFGKVTSRTIRMLITLHGNGKTWKLSVTLTECIIPNVVFQGDPFSPFSFTAFTVRVCWSAHVSMFVVWPTEVFSGETDVASLPHLGNGVRK